MLGWTIYAIGALTVSTELMESPQWTTVPRNWLPYAAGITFLLSLFWPVFGLVVVILRLFGRFRHG